MAIIFFYTHQKTKNWNTESLKNVVLSTCMSSAHPIFLVLYVHINSKQFLQQKCQSAYNLQNKKKIKMKQSQNTTRSFR